MYYYHRLSKQTRYYLPLLLLSTRVLGYILLYYLFSISLTFYNKWILTDFPFPLSATLFQSFLTFIVTCIIRECLSLYTRKPAVRVGGLSYVRNVLPTSITAAFDIGLSNWSFQFITVSLYTMCKTSAVIFILFFAIVFRLEKFRLRLVGIVLLISLGLFLFTFDYTFFNLTGFALVMTASLLSGLRWNTAQFLVQKSQLGLENPIDILYHVTPVMSFCLFPLAFIFEGVGLATSLVAFRAQSPSAALLSFGLILCSALLALGIGFAEYLLVQRTSSLTLSISSIFKEVLVLYIAIAWFHPNEHLKPINIVGMILCLLGIALHIWSKAVIYRAKLKRDRTQETQVQMELLIREDELLREDLGYLLSESDSN